MYGRVFDVTPHLHGATRIYLGWRKPCGVGERHNAHHAAGRRLAVKLKQATSSAAKATLTLVMVLVSMPMPMPMPTAMASGGALTIQPADPAVPQGLAREGRLLRHWCRCRRRRRANADIYSRTSVTRRSSTTRAGLSRDSYASYHTYATGGTTRTSVTRGSTATGTGRGGAVDGRPIVHCRCTCTGCKRTRRTPRRRTRPTGRWVPWRPPSLASRRGRRWGHRRETHARRCRRRSNAATTAAPPAPPRAATAAASAAAAARARPPVVVVVVVVAAHVARACPRV